MKPNDRFHPFSNGTEYMMWTARNCERGERGCRNYNPNAATSRDGCPMEVAIALAALTDGTMKAKHGLRCGICAAGPKGEIVRDDEGDCTTWRCPEYRGYDEPDDRPRLGPRQPEDQLDVFDPRLEPARPGVPAHGDIKEGK